MTWLVAAVAVETGIPPQFLLEDEHMLGAMLAYMKHRSDEQRKAAKRRG